MLEKYINWDDVAIKALRRHDENQVALVNLREEYEAITDGLGAVDYAKDRVDSSGDGDSAMVNRLLQKDAVAQKIRELEREERQYSRAWDALDDDERRVLSEFFQRGRRRSQEAVDTLCDLYGYERTKIWDMRREAVRRFNEKKIEKIQKQQIAVQSVEQIEAKPVPLSSKVMLERSEYETLSVAAKKYITQEKKTSKLQKALDAANKLISELKAKVASLSAELSEYKSIRSKLNAAGIEQENEVLRGKVRRYEAVIERNNLWHLFGRHREKALVREDIR